MKDLIILIPPSEGKAEGGNEEAIKTSAEVKAQIKRLQNYSGDIEKLLGVKGKALKKAKKANKNILKSKTMPAIKRYTGVVYAGIDYANLRIENKKYFDKHVRIVSALFGLVTPQDKIPNYKLKIEKLDSAKYWKTKISEKLKNKYVIDLLPQSHKKAVEYKDGIQIEFKITKKGKTIPAGHKGKYIKGRYIRWLCQTKTKDITKFFEDGFKWNGKYYLKEV